MKKKIAKLLALGMSIALVFSLAACGGNGDTNESESQSESQSVAADVTDDSAVPASEDASASAASGEDTSATQGENPGSDDNNPGGGDTGLQAPTDTAGVVNMYNNAIGSAGFNTANIQLTWGGSDTTIGELDSITGGKVKPEFEKPLSKSVTPGSINAGDVASASAADNGSTITLTIKLKNTSGDSGTQYGAGSYPYFINYSDALELLDRCGKAAANLSISISEKSTKLEMSNGVITATIDKANGAMTGMSFELDQTVSGKAMGFVNATIWGHGVATFA